MAFVEPTDFREAVENLRGRGLLPTTLGSEDLMELRADLRERAFLSARVRQLEILQRAKDLVTEIVQPKRVERVDETTGERRLVTEGVDIPTGRLRMKEFLDATSYRAAEGDEGTIKDLRSDARLNLILRTNSEMAQNFGWNEQGQDPVVLEAYPAQEFYRAEERKEKRNWVERARAAAAETDSRVVFKNEDPWNPVFVGLKNDPFWERLSVFGLPYAPFDFNSGMDLRDVSREEAEQLGLIASNQEVAPRSRRFNEGLELSPEVRDAELRAALEADLPEGFEFEDDVLVKI